MYVYVNVYVYVYVYVHVNSDVDVYVCVHVYVYVSVHAYCQFQFIDSAKLVSWRNVTRKKTNLSNSHVDLASQRMAPICTDMLVRGGTQSGKLPESLREGIMALDKGVAPNEDIGEFLTIHSFGHQSGRCERSGGLSTANIHDFSARVLLNHK